MQKPDASLIAGFNAWKNNFGRNVMKGQKGIKILAPSPFKIKKEMEKIDPQTQKAIIGKDGKPVTEEKEITIPAFKVVSVFDAVSYTHLLSVCCCSLSWLCPGCPLVGQCFPAP